MAFLFNASMVGLGHIQSLMIVTAFIFMTEAEVPLCTPAEEHQPHNITLSFNGTKIVWYKKDSEIVSCTVSNSRCVTREENSRYTATVSSRTSILYISDVTRDSGGTYRCTSEMNASCDLTVYAKPTSVSCQQAALQADSVTVVCSVTRIYPNPVCQFEWTINSTESHTIQEEFLTVHQTGYGDPVYYNASCSLKLPAQNFSVGSHQFQVRVYPNVTGNNSDSAFITNSSWTSPQSVAYPSVRLDPCPITDTYVEEGKPFNCTCRETANSFILANTTLSYGSASFSSTQNATANFTADRNKGALTCDAQLPDGTENSLTQTVKVAYGPKTVSMKVDQAENGVISLCDQPVTVTVTCSFPVNDTSPGVKYQLSSNLTETQTGFSNMSTYNYTVTRGGLIYFLCTARNSGISSLSANTTTVIQITEPPSPPVIEKYQDGGTSVIVAGDQLTVQEGQVTRIGCSIKGGYPPVSALSLECDPQTNTSRSSNVYMDVNISRQMDGSNCSCTATHNSSCYRNNMAVTVLNVHFGPTIFSFEANNNKNSEKIILDTNSGVSFSCQAEGNPSLRLSLRKNRAELQTFSDPSQKFNLTLNYSKPIAECLDTGVYMCLAEAGPRSTNKTVAVYVKCMPQFKNPELLNNVHQVRVNGTMSIIVPVFGYPEPNVTLSGAIHSLSANDYNLTYIPLEPPNGSVSLMIQIKNASFFQNYTLNITNSEGPLTFSFEIIDGDPVHSNSENNDSSGQDVGAIVGGIVAAVLVIVIIFVIIFLWKRKGGPCKGEIPPNGSALMDTAYGSDLSVNHHADSADAEVTIDNSALYHMGEKSLKSDEVTVDNSDLYNLNWRSDEVVVDNSDLYNLNHPTPGSTVRDSKYKNYSEVVPTITTATSLPLNMRNKKTEDTSSPYEDVSSGDKSKPKPPAPQKPKPVAKPKPQTGKQSKSPPTDETYAMVVKVAKSDKPFAIKEETDDFFYDPSQQPEIPEKNFENPYEDTNNEKITQKKTPDRKKKNTGKPSGKASEQHNNPSSPGYTNGGFSNPEDELNVYENT